MQTYDTRPKRCLFEVLASQGMHVNQQFTFVTDGGEDIADVPRHLKPQAEHLLDWFHITMRIPRTYWAHRSAAPSKRALQGTTITEILVCANCCAPSERILISAARRSSSVVERLKARVAGITL